MNHFSHPDCAIVTRRSARLRITDSSDASMMMLQDPTGGIATAGLMLGGGLLSAAGTLAGGNAAKQMGLMQQNEKEFEAQQEQENSAADIAQGQQAGIEASTKANLLKSSAVATAAAGGVETTSGSAVTNQAQIDVRGKYAAAMDLWNGQNAATADLNKAAAAQYTGLMDAAGGDMAQQGSELAAAGTLMSSGGSAFKAYSSFGKFA